MKRLDRSFRLPDPDRLPEPRMDGVEFGVISLSSGERMRFDPQQLSWFFYVRAGTMEARSDGEPPLVVREGECFGIDGREGFELVEGEGRRGGTRTFEMLEPYSEASGHALSIIAAHAPLSANVLLSSFSQRIHVSRDDPGPTFLRVKALVDFVEDELSGGELLVDSQAVLQRLAELIVVTLVRHMVAASTHIRAVLPTALVDRRLWQALGAFQRTPASKWTVQRLAKVAGMSRTGFAIRFRELVGEPPLHILTQIRMNMASGMLERDDTLVKQIAEAVGYGTVAAFCRAFRRHFGESPGRWRQSRLPDTQKSAACPARQVELTEPSAAN